MADNKAIMVRFINECWNVRSRSICKELLARDYEHYMPGSERPIVGPEAYQQLVDGFLEAFPDMRFDIEDVFGEDEKVCVVWTARATHRGTFDGRAATKRPVIIRGVAVCRVVDKWIVRIVSMFDNQSLTRQLEGSADKPAS